MIDQHLYKHISSLDKNDEILYPSFKKLYLDTGYLYQPDKSFSLKPLSTSFSPLPTSMQLLQNEIQKLQTANVNIHNTKFQINPLTSLDTQQLDILSDLDIYSRISSRKTQLGLLSYSDILNKYLGGKNDLENLFFIKSISWIEKEKNELLNFNNIFKPYFATPFYRLESFVGYQWLSYHQVKPASLSKYSWLDLDKPRMIPFNINTLDKANLLASPVNLFQEAPAEKIQNNIFLVDQPKILDVEKEMTSSVLINTPKELQEKNEFFKDRVETEQVVVTKEDVSEKNATPTKESVVYEEIITENTELEYSENYTRLIEKNSDDFFAHKDKFFDVSQISHFSPGVSLAINPENISSVFFQNINPLDRARLTASTVVLNSSLRNMPLPSFNELVQVGPNSPTLPNPNQSPINSSPSQGESFATLVDTDDEPIFPSKSSLPPLEENLPLHGDQDESLLRKPSYNYLTLRLTHLKNNDWQNELIEKIKLHDRSGAVSIFSVLSMEERKQFITEDNDTAIHVACRYGTLEIIEDFFEYLDMQAAVTIAKKNNQANTGLHLAAYYLPQAIPIILNVLNESSPTILMEFNDAGLNPVQIAAMCCENKEVIHYLKQMLTLLGTFASSVFKTRKKVNLITWLKENHRMDTALWLQLFRGVVLNNLESLSWFNRYASQNNFFDIDLSGLVLRNSELSLLLKIKKIVSLNLQNCELQPIATEVFQELLSRSDIETINVSHNELDNPWARTVVENIRKNFSVIRFDIAHNPINETIMSFFIFYQKRNVSYLKTISRDFKEIKKLNLHGHCVDDDFLLQISPLLVKAVHLTHLDLSDNAISSEGVKILEKAVPHTLICMDLSGNLIDNVSSGFLKKLSTSCIQELNLSHNYIEKNEIQWGLHCDEYRFIKNCKTNKKTMSLALKETEIDKKNWNIYLVQSILSTTDRTHVKIVIEGMDAFGQRFIETFHFLPKGGNVCSRFFFDSGLVKRVPFQASRFHEEVNLKSYAYYQWPSVHFDIAERLRTIIYQDMQNPPAYQKPGSDFFEGMNCYTWALRCFNQVGLKTDDVTPNRFFAYPDLQRYKQETVSEFDKSCNV